MPFLFWWSTWFGRQLSDQQLTEYLKRRKAPDGTFSTRWCSWVSALAAHDASAARWYPELVRLASYPVEEVRNTDAWVMGQDTSAMSFHANSLKDAWETHRLWCAVTRHFHWFALATPQAGSRFVALLQPARIIAPNAGRGDRRRPRRHHDPPGWPHCETSELVEQTTEVRSPISGRIRTIAARRAASVAAGANWLVLTLATIRFGKLFARSTSSASLGGSYR